MDAYFSTLFCTMKTKLLNMLHLWLEYQIQYTPKVVVIDNNLPIALNHSILCYHCRLVSIFRRKVSSEHEYDVAFICSSHALW